MICPLKITGIICGLLFMVSNTFAQPGPSEISFSLWTDDGKIIHGKDMVILKYIPYENSWDTLQHYREHKIPLHRRYYLENGGWRMPLDANDSNNVFECAILWKDTMTFTIIHESDTMEINLYNIGEVGDCHVINLKFRKGVYNWDLGADYEKCNRPASPKSEKLPFGDNQEYLVTHGEAYRYIVPDLKKIK